MKNPLIERRDYGKDGKDIIDKNIDDLKILQEQNKKKKISADFESMISSIVKSRRN